MATSLVVDRSELADTAQPDQLADLLISQLAPQLTKLLPLPIVDVAMACGILEIRALETNGFEGGLIQDEAKQRGYILVKASPYEQRSRFTIAHELGHFVNLRHVAPPGTEQLLCNKDDLRASGASQGGRHGMEAQANEFAACLLMPSRLVGAQSFMKGSPEIARILALQALCDISKEAASRRYAQLHGGDFAVLFTQEGKLVGCPIRAGDFPWIDLKPGQPVYRGTLTKTFSAGEGDVSEQEECDSAWWLAERDAKAWSLWEEVLIQQRGFRMTLLLGERIRRERNWEPGFR